VGEEGIGRDVGDTVGTGDGEAEGGSGVEVELVGSGGEDVG
jgi:hypothetical protein